jgi:hypothetical protein
MASTRDSSTSPTRGGAVEAGAKQRENNTTTTINDILSAWEIQSIADILPADFGTACDSNSGIIDNKDWQPATLEVLGDLAGLLKLHEIKKSLKEAWAKRGLGYLGREFGNTWVEQEANLRVDLLAIRKSIYDNHDEQLRHEEERPVGSDFEEQDPVTEPTHGIVAHNSVNGTEDVAELITRIEDGWEQGAIHVVPDMMRKHFRYPDEPLKWDVMALKGLCRIADKKTSEDLDDLRSSLYRGYSNRTRDALQTKELTVQDSEYVLERMGRRRLVLQSLPRRWRAITAQQHGHQPPLTQATQRRIKAELNLSIGLARRRVLDAQVAVEMSKRDIEVMQPHRPGKGLRIKYAELAVDEARAKVQKERGKNLELRRKFLQEANSLAAEDARSEDSPLSIENVA